MFFNSMLKGIRGVIFYVKTFSFWKESWAEIINKELLNFKAGFVMEKKLGLDFPKFHNIGLSSLVKASSY